MPDTPRPVTTPGRPLGLRGGGFGRSEGANLADILERVLDKGIVIAGDIRVNLLDIELLTIRVRLLIASVDRAREMGIDWWERDPSLSSGQPSLTGENARLRERVAALEAAAVPRDAEGAYVEPALTVGPGTSAVPVSPDTPAVPLPPGPPPDPALPVPAGNPGSAAPPVPPGSAASPVPPASPAPRAGTPRLGERTPVATANGKSGPRG
jgi:gas vesicle protein GvpA/GvpJ/GvpM family